MLLCSWPEYYFKNDVGPFLDPATHRIILWVAGSGNEPVTINKKTP